jgi:hypothetical protein
MKAVEIEGLSGFFKIPNFPLYGITINGAVMNLVTQKLLSEKISPDGYRTFILEDEDNGKNARGRHRLLGIVFKHPGIDITKLVVNHLNGIPGDDRLDNLEWITHQGNINHAGSMGLTEKCLPVSARCVLTGRVDRFPSATECGRVYGLTKDAILHRLRQGSKRVFQEMKQYRFGHSDEPWRIPTQKEIDNIRHGRARKVLARNVITNVVVEFEQAQEFARAHDFSLASVSTWLSSEKQNVLPGYIQIKWSDSDSDWRQISDPHAELAKTMGTKAIKAVLNDGSEMIFTSTKACANHFGISLTLLNYHLNSGRNSFKSAKFFYV